MDCLDFYYFDEDIQDIKRNLHKCSYSLPTLPKRVNDVLKLLSSMLPETSTEIQFSARPVSLGLTPDDFDLLRKHCNHPLYVVEQRELVFRLLRRFMLFMLIPCSGCTDINDLIDKLEEDFYSGSPAKVPRWYWLTVRSPAHDGKRIGYNFCWNKGCQKTEDMNNTFLCCSRCKVPAYCSKKCQVTDWKNRHRNKCDKEAMYRRQTNSRRVFVEHCLNSGISMNKLDRDCLLFYRGKK
eukprot:157515_1